MPLRKPLFLLFAGFPLAAEAQPRSYRQALPEVPAASYYRIALTPALTARAAPDLHDLRLRDARGAEIPYALDEPRTAWTGRGFRPFDVLRQGREADGYTHILLHTDNGRPLDELLLEVRNTGAARTASVSGSNDGRQFFALRDTVHLGAPARRAGDTAVYALPLPQTRYPYLQVTLFDDKLLPVEVLCGGVRQDSSGQVAAYRAVPPPVITQQDSSDRRSYIRLHFDAPYRIDRLRVFFAGPALYRRSLTVLSGGVAVATAVADPAGPASVPVALHDADVLLVVENEDNPPLRVASVEAAQRAQDVLAWLEPGTTYALQAGDGRLRTPLYDLRYYADSIRRLPLPVLVPVGAPVLAASGEGVRAGAASWREKGLLWGTIVLVLAGLVWMTLRLARRLGPPSA